MLQFEVAVRAHDLALRGLAQHDRQGYAPVAGVADVEVLALAGQVIELHHVRRVLDAAARTGDGLQAIERLPNVKANVQGDEGVGHRGKITG